MSSTIFLIIALVTTGIFVIQFILSIFFGDIDADVDVDTDISSVVSFKGLTHFGIGFGWFMYLKYFNDVTIESAYHTKDGMMERTFRFGKKLSLKKK